MSAEIWIALGVMLLIIAGCGFGMMLAKAAHQREEAEREVFARYQREQLLTRIRDDAARRVTKKD